MGRHAKPRERVGARRAAALSTGTLVLCLWGAGSAMAGTGGGLDTTDPLPAPKVPDPVVKVVQKVSDTVGVPNPIASPAPKPTHDPAPAPKPVPHPQPKPGSSHVPVPQPVAHAPAPHTVHHQVAAHQLTVAAPQTHRFTTHVETLAPATSGGYVTGVLASGPTAGLTPHPFLSGGTGDTDAPRGILLVIAALVSAGLAFAHLRVAQRQLAYLPE